MDDSLRKESTATARDAAAAAQEKVESLVDAAQRKVVEQIQPAKRSIDSFARQQQQLGADQVGGLARAAHRAAEEVEGQMPGIARSVHKAAARLDAASSSLREQSVEELMQNVGAIARERPALLFGGALLAGFALSRFLKASAQR